ncbi:hypothetical protein CPB84DRAFT_260114 [Gymnopilus junonius]|uniref:Uncharacterized protein n=1 Tax=Gymnopilus junonius TaxID=109634 RepID=A0A9P5NE62_GYMJU|nr:hypothetical protein CPB84DRAFT_260114 [Gymnopilus junonius]
MPARRVLICSFMKAMERRMPIMRRVTLGIILITSSSKLSIHRMPPRQRPRPLTPKHRSTPPGTRHLPLLKLDIRRPHRQPRRLRRTRTSTLRSRSTPRPSHTCRARVIPLKVTGTIAGDTHQCIPLRRGVWVRDETGGVVAFCDDFFVNSFLALSVSFIFIVTFDPPFI